MHEQRITVEIDHDGHIAAEAEGFTGESSGRMRSLNTRSRC